MTFAVLDNKAVLALKAQAVECSSMLHNPSPPAFVEQQVHQSVTPFNFFTERFIDQDRQS